ncbi:translation initiation factor IF-2 [Candidatus Pacearchaeota archaeon]|nr:translation initiation factor IF-2 [Candidatus Pacearchaeota archaeon]
MKNKNSETKIRQPIVTVCGHVDHGKTSILDSLRGTCVQASESGGITQKISFTLYPTEILKQSCPLIETSGIKLNIPGFLFIDTPGHAAFTNLRKRGGNLADLAVLVIDINEGIKPQTAEVIQILKLNKVPFIIALNKIDNISGWRSPKNFSDTKNYKPIKEIIQSQQSQVQQTFQERYLTLIGSLQSHGFDADLFYNVTDFTKKIALIPVSAQTREGIQELTMMLCGLSQKYLSDKLTLNEDAKGVILEIKKQRTGTYAEAILYDGELSKNQEIAISNFSAQLLGKSEPIITKIRVMEEIEPLCARFSPKEHVKASTGLRMQLTEKSSSKNKIYSGMPFVAFKNNKEEIQEIFKKEISDTIKSSLSKKGIIAKADSLGSLEALLTLLKENNIPVVKAGIGDINKTDIISAKANLEINELDAVIVGFNTSIDEEAKEFSGNAKIKIIIDDVVYKLIEELSEFRNQKQKEIEKKRLMGLTTICKLKILHQYVFRNTNPAIFGVRVEAGKLTQGLELIDEKNEKIGRVKNLQSESKSVSEAHEGLELAISIPGINFERTLKNREFLYTNISENQFKNLKKNKDLLSSHEISTIQEIAEIKRQKNSDWGR